MSLKFMHIFVDDKESFWLVLHFLSPVATIGMYYRSLQCRNTALGMFSRVRSFTVLGIASRKSVRFLTLR